MGNGIVDVTRAREEEERIRKNLSEYIVNADEIYDWLIANNAVEITPPEITDISMSFIGGKVSEESISLKTIKFGNVRYNLGKAFKALVHSTLEVTAVDASLGINKNTLASFILVSWAAYDNAKDAMTVELKKEQAYVTLALWELQQEERILTVYESFEYYNSRYGNTINMSIDYYENVLVSLEKLGCISIDDGEITIEEDVMYEYK